MLVKNSQRWKILWLITYSSASNCSTPRSSSQIKIYSYGATMSGCRNLLAYHLKQIFTILVVMMNQENSFNNFIQELLCMHNFLPFCLFINTHMNGPLRPLKLIPLRCPAIIMKQDDSKIVWKLQDNRLLEREGREVVGACGICRK